MAWVRSAALVALLVGPVALASADEASDPDFAAFLEQIEQTLAATGPGSQVGDRAERYRYAESGWEIRMTMAWTGERWHLLALRLHHPERVEAPEGQWPERYESLLADLDRDTVPDRLVPELIDVPPPDYTPAIPGERRNRRFTADGYWYEARWINEGSFDERASWRLRSYQLVAER